jgi:hypothetical protein
VVRQIRDDGALGTSATGRNSQAARAVVNVAGANDRYSITP